MKLLSGWVRQYVAIGAVLAVVLAIPASCTAEEHTESEPSIQTDAAAPEGGQTGVAAAPVDRNNLEEYLRLTQSISEETEIQLIPVETGFEGKWYVFYTSNPQEMVHRGVVVLHSGEAQVVAYESSPCYCTRISAQSVSLLKDGPGLVLTRFSPMSGSCVASEVIQLLRITTEGSFVTVWQGTTFDGSGSTSEVAEVRFEDRTSDGNSEIVRAGRILDCGDDCLCREGREVSRFQEIFAWNAKESRYVLQE